MITGYLTVVSSMCRTNREDVEAVNFCFLKVYRATGIRIRNYFHLIIQLTNLITYQVNFLTWVNEKFCHEWCRNFVVFNYFSSKHDFNFITIFDWVLCNYYRPRKRVGKGFTHVCVSVSLSVCLSLFPDHNFWTNWPIDFIFWYRSRSS